MRRRRRRRSPRLLLDMAAHGVADGDLAVGENVGAQAAAVDVRAQHARAGEPLEVRAGLAEPLPVALDRADREAPADERVEVDAARDDIAPRLLRRDQA